MSKYTLKQLKNAESSIQFSEIKILSAVCQSKKHFDIIFNKLGVEPRHFQADYNMALYDLVLTIYKNNEKPTIENVKFYVAENKIELPKTDYVDYLFKNVTNDEFIPEYAFKLLNLGLLNDKKEDLKVLSEEYLKAYAEGKADVSHYISRFEELNVDYKEKRQEQMEREQFGEEFWNTLNDSIKQTSSIQMTGDLSAFWNWLNSLDYGQLILFTGMTGSGKSALAQYLYTEFITRLQTKALYIDTEMGQKLFGRRLLAMLTHIPLDIIKQIKDLDNPDPRLIPPRFMENYKRAMQMIKMTDAFRYKNVLGMNFDKIRRIVEKAVLEGVKVIFIDYIGSCKVGESQEDKRKHEQMEYLSYELKRLAQEHQVLIICTGQVNKEGALSQRIKLEHLSGSFQMSYWYDLVASFYLPDIENPNEEIEELLLSPMFEEMNMIIEILKERDGDHVGGRFAFHRDMLDLTCKALALIIKEKKFNKYTRNEQAKMKEFSAFFEQQGMPVPEKFKNTNNYTPKKVVAHTETAEEKANRWKTEVDEKNARLGYGRGGGSNE